MTGGQRNVFDELDQQFITVKQDLKIKKSWFSAILVVSFG